MSNSEDEVQGVDDIGVDNGMNGRSCNEHPICGHLVKEGDKLFCKWEVQQFEENEEPEGCIQVFEVGLDGLATCHAGYLPKQLLKKDQGKVFHDAWHRVIQDYRLSDYSSERQRSHRNYGLIYCTVIKNNPRYSGKNPFELPGVDLSDNDTQIDALQLMMEWMKSQQMKNTSSLKEY
jgi:hypothetical protein